MTIAARIRPLDVFPEPTDATVEQAYDAILTLQEPGVEYSEPNWIVMVDTNDVVREFDGRCEADLLCRPNPPGGHIIIAALLAEPGDNDRLIAELAAAKSRVTA